MPKFRIVLQATLLHEDGSVIASKISMGELIPTLNPGDDPEGAALEEFSTAFGAAENGYESCVQGELALDRM